jgi:hypothetical protein
MKSKLKCLLIIPLLLIISCERVDPGHPNEPGEEKNIGTVEFDFPITAIHAPVNGIHRIDLSLALTAYDIYRGDFLISANVSDEQRTYEFKLTPGDYYFQAGMGCSCLGDTCLWDGYPGGRFGTKWVMDKITIVKGETLFKRITFNQ